MNIHLVVHNFTGDACVSSTFWRFFGRINRHLRTDQNGIITNGARPKVVRWGRGHWVPATPSRARQVRSPRGRLASGFCWRHAQAGARTMRSVGQGKSGEHPTSLPQLRYTEAPSRGSPLRRLDSLCGSLWVQVVVELHLPDFLLQQAWWNLLMIPLQPQSHESHWDQRQGAVQDEDDRLGRRSSRPLHSSLRLEDASTRPLREGFPVCELGSRLMEAHWDFWVWAALMLGYLIHSGVWVKARTRLGGRTQRMNSFEVWFQVTYKGTVHLRTVCRRQTEVLGRAGWRDRMDVLKSVKTVW